MPLVGLLIGGGGCPIPPRFILFDHLSVTVPLAPPRGIKGLLKIGGAASLKSGLFSGALGKEIFDCSSLRRLRNVE